ncbi:TetR/AcrR family transcriptional regulator [Streptomyces sp. NPDC004629]|uniref:TetR/AcrR family transcriptional regulator n=1 Tax=Streptomyces sp. NPDC004629 TaxID=3364705 RepID=UPI0036CC2835
MGAAEALFIAEGYENASVDAIAARAEVSKRTVYDHFGGKERLLSAVMADVTSSLLEAVRRATREELPDGCDPGPSLLAFTRRVATVTFGSSEYVQFRKLLAAAGPLRGSVMQELDDPAELLMERITAFGDTGALHVPNPRRATEHFVALTFLVALEALDRQQDPDVIDELLVDGVEAFLRAYGPRSEAGRPRTGASSR